MTTTATFRLSSDELDDTFVEKVKALFAHQEVEIIVRESESDETEQIRMNPDLHARLMEASNRVDRREGLVEFNPE